MSTATTRDQLLDHAQTLIRQRGCNGFSYRDLAEQVGVKTASIHYYFPCKDDLLLEAVNVYVSKVAAMLRAIDDSLPAAQRLDRYAALFESGPPDQVCMCGMLAADFASLSDRVRQALQGFFRLHEDWLAKVIADGAREGTLKSSGDPRADGRALFAAMQGALMSGRLFQNSTRVHDVIANVRVQPAEAAHPA